MLRIISHRGNLNGPDKENENRPSQIMLAISKGFNVEIDLWAVDNDLYLGHDQPQYKIDKSFLEKIEFESWVHCKNLEAIKFLQSEDLNLNYFWHQNDDFTLTSWGYVWTYPGKETFSNSVIVDLSAKPNTNLEAFGICTDYPEGLLS